MREQRRLRPSLLVRACVRWLAPVELRDEILGDLEERYHQIATDGGRIAAEAWAIHQLRTMRPFALRRAVRESGVKREGVRMGDVLKGDLRSALRRIRTRPAAAGTVIATVALAIAGTTSVFSVVNGVLLRPLPYPESDQLARLWQVNEAWLDSPNSQLRSFASNFPLDIETFRDWAEADLGFESLGAVAGREFVNQTADGAIEIDGAIATSGIFDLFRIEPQLGRRLIADDDLPGADRVAVLSHGLWQDRYASDPSILGSSITLDGSPHTIVGVMPPEFALPGRDGRIWTPLSEEEKVGPRDSQYLEVYGRLNSGVSLAAAEERLVAFQGELSQIHDTRFTARAVTALESVVGHIGTTLWFLLGAVGLVLLIACVNIANVMSVSALARKKELAVKTALGAARGRIVGELLVESILLASFGGALGILLAGRILPFLVSVLPGNVPRVEGVGMSVPVILFGLGTTMLTAIVVGTLPALQASGVRPGDTIRAASRGNTADRGSQRVRSALVVTEVGLAFVLILAAGLLGRSFLNLWTVERGFNAEGLVMFAAYPNENDYPEVADRRAFTRELRDQLEAIPGVSVTAANQVPLMRSMSSTSYQVERPGGEPEDVNVVISVVLESYLDVMEIPLLSGRGLGSGDVDGAPLVGVANRAMAEAYWPGENAIGKRMRTGDEAEWTEIIGVVENVRHQGLDVEIEPKLYVPVWQNRRQPGHWILRTRGDLGATAELAREAVSTVSPSTPARQARIVETEIAVGVAVPRFRTLFSLGLAGLAAILALIGVYGVVAFSVNQKTKEIGVRMALGAARTRVVGRIVVSGLRMTALGIALGLAATYGLTRIWSEQVGEFLHGIGARDPGTLVVIGLGVTVVAGIAAWLPARRAASIDPVTVLKSE